MTQWQNTIIIWVKVKVKKRKEKKNRLSVIYSFHELRIFLVLKAGYTFQNSLICLQVDGRMQRWFSQHRQQHEVCWAQFAMWWKLNEPKTGMHQQPWATIKHHQSVELQSTGLFDFSTRVSCSISPSWVTTEAGTLWEGQPLISETIYCVFTWEDQKSQRTDKPGEGGNWTRVNLERPPAQHTSEKILQKEGHNLQMRCHHMDMTRACWWHSMKHLGSWQNIWWVDVIWIFCAVIIFLIAGL